MNDRERIQSDVLDRATEALRHAPVPDGPPQEVLAAVIDAGARDDASSQPVQYRERKHVMLRRVFRIVAAVAIVVGVGALALHLVYQGPTVAFAQIREEILQLQTMTCRIQVDDPTAEGKPRKVDVRAFFQMPDKMRLEVTEAEGQAMENPVIVIIDGGQGKMLNLHVAAEGPHTKEGEKIAVLVDFGEWPKELLEQEHPNLAVELKELCRGRGTVIGKRDIDGRPAVGFHVVTPERTGEIWVDAATGEDVLLAETDIPGQGHLRISDFKINPPLDPALFSVDAPEGYRLVAVPRLPLANLAEADLTAWLEFLATYNDGRFPDEPKLNRKIVLNMEKRFAAETATVPPAERQQAAAEQAAKRQTLTIRGAVFMKIHEATFRYVGADVALGDGGAPVCWYRPKGSSTWRVVYGDLRVADVAEQDLPAAAGP